MTAARSSPDGFFAKARHRHLFRVAAFYGAAAFVVLQLAEITFPAFGIPDWVTRILIVGTIAAFPFVMLTAWAYHRAGPGEAPASAGRASSAGPTTKSPSRSVLAVVPFSVRGSREFAYLSDGIVDLLSSKLRLAEEIRCIDPNAVLSFSDRGDGEGGIDPQRARVLAERFGAGLFVLGHVVEAGGRLHIDATLYESKPSLDIVARATAEGSGTRAFDLVDDIAHQLLTALTDDLSPQLTRLAVTTTGSFPAIKSYLEGENEMRAMRRVPALAAFQHAVREDPAFALAWYRLAVAALWSGQLELARDATEQATNLSDRLSEHHRLLLQAFSSFLTGDADQAERLYRIIVGNQPHDVEAWYQLAEVLFHYNPRRGGSVRDSRSPWERVLELEPEHVSALVHLAVIAACEGKLGEVNDLVERAVKISPGGDAVLWMRALRAWQLGDGKEKEKIAQKLRDASDFAVARCAWALALPSRDLESAEAITRLLTEPSRAPDVRAVGHVWLAYLELAHGRWSAAQEQLDVAERFHPSSVIHLRSMAQLAPFLDASREELNALHSALSAWDADATPHCMTAGPYFTVHNGAHSQLRRYLLGVTAARLGDEDEALGHAKALEGAGDRPETRDLALNQARSIRALIDRNRGRVEEAISGFSVSCPGALFELTIASPFFSQAYERYANAELLSGMGRIDESLCWYGSFAEHSIYDLIYLAPANLRRAEIYERLGQPDRAAAYYERFIALWRDADPELRTLVESARQRLAALRAEAEGSSPVGLPEVPGSM